MIDDQTLLRMAKSMDSLNQTILSMNARLQDGIGSLDEIYDTMYQFNIADKQQTIQDLDAKQNELIVECDNLRFSGRSADDIINDTESRLDGIINSFTGGLQLDKISTTSDDIGELNNKCIVEQIKIIFNKLNSIGMEMGKSSQLKSLPNAQTSGGGTQGGGEDTPQDEQYNENVLAYIASSKSGGQTMCVGRFAQFLMTKFKIKNQNIKFFIKGKSSGTLTCSAATNIKVSYKFTNDSGIGNKIVDANVPLNGMVFLCVQGITTQKPDINDLISKINALTNIPIFILLDIGHTPTANYFIDNIKTSNPCLIWSSPNSLLSSKTFTGAGGYLMNLLQQIVTPSSTQYEKASYQVMFDLMLSKYDKMTKTNLNNFNESLPIFTI